MWLEIYTVWIFVDNWQNRMDISVRELSSSSSSTFYFQQNTTMEQYQEKENTL